MHKAYLGPFSFSYKCVYKEFFQVHIGDEKLYTENEREGEKEGVRLPVRVGSL